DPVSGRQIRADPRGYRLLPHVHVHEPGDLSGSELPRHPLLEEPDGEHRPVKTAHGRGIDGADDHPAHRAGSERSSTRRSRVPRNGAAGAPSTARWSNVRHAIIVGRTTIAPSATTGRSLIRPTQRIPH